MSSYFLILVAYSLVFLLYSLATLQECQLLLSMASAWPPLKSQADNPNSYKTRQAHH